MRNSTLFAIGLAAMMAMPAAAAEKTTPLKMMKDTKAHVFGKQPRTKGKKVKGHDGLYRMSELAQKMKPGTAKTFAWDGEDWMEEDTYTYAYDTNGNVTTENAVDADGACTRTINEYDQNGMVKSKMTTVSEDGIDFENYSKSEFQYDPILTDVITERGEWLWMGAEWQQVANNYRRIITRDEKGNITSVVIAVLFQGEYDPTQKIEVTYGEDGKATVISEQVLSFDYGTYEYYWEQGTVISDIAWERTDGQIYSIDDLFTGNNRIGSAHYMDEDEMDMNVTVEYAADSEAYKATMVMTMDDMSVTGVTEYTPLENDGYMVDSEVYFMGMTLQSLHEECRYDDWGLMTLESVSETYDDETYTENTVGDVEYDAEGKPSVYTISVSYFEPGMEEEESEYVLRAEYSDYVDVTVGSGVAAIGAEASEKYYDLNGVEVAAPCKGSIVVTKSGAKVKY